MTKHRWLRAFAGAAAAAGALLACTLTQSLDYLQTGNDAEGGTPVIPEGGVGDGDSNGPGRTPEVLVPTQTKPRLLAQDGNTLYWVADGKVQSVPKAGGAAKTLGSAPPEAARLAVDGSAAGFVFVAARNDVHRFAKDGSQATTPGLAVFVGGANAPPADAIAADDSSLFVLQYDLDGTFLPSRILRMALDGGVRTDFALDGGPSTMNADQTSVMWLDTDPTAPSFRDQEKAAPDLANTRLPLGAGLADEVPDSSRDVAYDADYVYWISYSTSVVYRRGRLANDPPVPIGRGAEEELFATIALDAQFVYCLETAKSSLVRIPKGGGNPERLVAGLQAPSGLVVDTNAIYMTLEAVGNMGSVVKLAK